jgi:hypothetical protein
LRFAIPGEGLAGKTAANTDPELTVPRMLKGPSKRGNTMGLIAALRRFETLAWRFSTQRRAVMLTKYVKTWTKTLTQLNRERCGVSVEHDGIGVQDIWVDERVKIEVRHYIKILS